MRCVCLFSDVSGLFTAADGSRSPETAATSDTTKRSDETKSSQKWDSQSTKGIGTALPFTATTITYVRFFVHR